jgi:hypothetical protein
MFVSGEAWRLFKRAHPEQDFSDFWLEASLKFSMGCFDLSSVFLFRKKRRSASSTSRSAEIPKTLPMLAIWAFILNFALTVVIIEELFGSFYANKETNMFFS